MQSDNNLSLSPVVVSTHFVQHSIPYGLRGVAILVESDHEGMQAFRSMAQVEQGYDVDSEVWKRADAYFEALNRNDGLFEVISYDRNYRKPTNNNVPTKPVDPVHSGAGNDEKGGE